MTNNNLHLLNNSIIEFEKPEIYNRRVKNTLLNMKDTMVLDHLKEQVCIFIDFDTYAYANLSHKQFFNLAAGNFNGKKIGEVFDPAAAAMVLKKMSFVTEHKTEVSFEMHCKDYYDQGHCLNMRYIPVLDINSEVAFVIWFAADITEKVILETQLRLKDKRYQDIVDNQEELICRWLPDTTLLCVNRSFAMFFGRIPDEIVGTQFIHMFDEDKQEKVKQLIKSISVRTPIIVNELEIKDTNGELRCYSWRNNGYFDESGNLIEVQSVGWDITQHKQKEMQLLNRYRVLKNEVTVKSTLLENYKQSLMQAKQGKKSISNELKRIQSFTKSLFDNTLISVVTMNRDMEIIRSNASAWTVLCAPYEVLEGKQLSDYLIEDDRLRFQETLARANARVSVSFRVKGRQGIIKHCMGNLFYSSDMVILLFKDISSQYELTEQLNMQLAIHNMLANALAKTQMVSDNEVLSLLLADITEEIAHTLNLNHCHVNLISNQKNIYVQYPAKEKHDEEVNSRVFNHWLIQLRNYPLHYIHRDCTTSVLEDEFLDSNGLKSVIIVPVFLNKQLPGYLCLGSENDQRWSQYVEKSLGIITEIIALALERINLHSQIGAVNNYYQAILEKSDQRTNRILSQVVYSLATAVRFRDPYTAGHLSRTTRLAVAIAEILGLADESIQALSIAAAIHDVGKLAIPMEILNKPGRLTSEEYSIIKSHSRAGYEITKEIEFPWPVSQIILQHHERMNGSGYPVGLCGEEILMEARILAVADVVEAMLSQKPYRVELGMEGALRELIEHKGVLYDEKVVKACIAIMENTDFMLDVNNEKERLLYDQYHF